MSDTSVAAKPTVARTILVVDDMASVRFSHSAILRKAGYECVVACNGNEALEVLRTRLVDLVVLDLSMPVMDGYAFLTRIRAEAKTARLPIVVLAFDIRDERLRPFQDDRIFRTLAKPLDFHILLDHIKRMLPPSG